MIGKIIGNRKIVSEIGEGGMGVVYLAEHLTLKKKLFAVKSLSAALTADTNFRQRFYQEAQNQALLDHPNIVQAIDFFEKDDQFLFVMAYVNGPSLDKIIREKGSLKESEALPIIKGILDGLNFAHGKGIIHRDIKPSNIIIDEDGRAKITDFGIAILAGDRRLTATGSNIGSPWYMSPEQILHPKDVEHRSDVYSVGIVLYEMLTGEVPFNGETDYAVKTKQVKSPVPDPRQKNADISPQVAKMIVKAMEKDPDKRFATCGEFLKCIEAYEKEKASERPPWHQKLIGILAALSMAGIVVVVSLFYVDQQRTHTPVPIPQPKRLTDAEIKVIDDLLEIAALHFAMGRIAEPPGSNAMDAYQRILAIDPQDTQALLGLEQSVHACERMARKRLADNDHNTARRLVETCLQASPDHLGLQGLQKTFDDEE